MLLALLVNILFVRSVFLQYMYLRTYPEVVLSLTLSELLIGVSLTLRAITWFTDLLSYLNIYRFYRLLNSLSCEELEELVCYLKEEEKE